MLAPNLKFLIMVSSLYGKPGFTNVIATRVMLFKTGKHMDKSLPPNSDSLKQHLLRANYQAGIHRRCLEPRPDVPNPDGHGWLVDELGLKIKWMNLLPPPDAVLELVNCKCKRTLCKTDACTCASSKLNCTDSCACQSCENREQHADPVEKDEDEDSDVDEDAENSEFFDPCNKRIIFLTLDNLYCKTLNIGC